MTRNVWLILASRAGRGKVRFDFVETLDFIGDEGEMVIDNNVSTAR